MKTLIVKFKEQNSVHTYGKKYSYMYEGDDARVGQLAVVDSPSQGYVLVEIVEIKDGTSCDASKRIVSLVDDTRYKSIKEAQEERAKILRDLAQRDQKRREEERFAYLADKDEGAKLLLDRLAEINTTLAA